MKTFIINSRLSSPPGADQREVIYPSWEKSGHGRFFDNDALFMNSLATQGISQNKGENR
jgi:hypothetical protein